MIDKKLLQNLYTTRGTSMQDIATSLNCSVNKIVYWMDKYQIPRRSISDAAFAKRYPNGNPFKVKPIKTQYDAQLYGIGLGLYWGEGNKANRYSVRLGNTDPDLIKIFIKFLVQLCGVDKNSLKFGLQIFSDLDSEKVLDYWIKELDVKYSQFYKITVTISGSIGTYRSKSKYGVVTVYYHNKRLRDILVNSLPR